MSQSSAGGARFLTVFAALAACAAAAVTAADSRTDRWWTGYGNGPDNSRYFPSRQITRPMSPAAGGLDLPVRRYRQRSDRRARRGLRSRPQRLAGGGGREDGKEIWIRENMNGMTSRGFNYWESRTAATAA